MTDYNEILDTQIDQDSAITEDLMTQIRDNPIAIAEGADGAPRVQGIALGGRFYGIIGASAGSWVTVSDAADVAAISMHGSLNGPLPELQIAFSTDSGSNWSSAVTLVDDNGEWDRTFSSWVDFEGGIALTNVSTSSPESITNSATFTARTSATNAFRVRSKGVPFEAVLLIEGGYS